MSAPVSVDSAHDEPAETPATPSTRLTARLVGWAATLTRTLFDGLTRRFGSVALVGILGLATAVVAVLQTRFLEQGDGCSPLPIALIRLEVTFSAPRFVTLLNGEAPCTANVVHGASTPGTSCSRSPTGRSSPRSTCGPSGGAASPTWTRRGSRARASGATSSRSRRSPPRCSTSWSRTPDCSSPAPLQGYPTPRTACSSRPSSSSRQPVPWPSGCCSCSRPAGSSPS